MMMNKKGSDWPAALLSMIFSVVLLLFGTMIIIDVVKFAEVKSVDYIGNLNFYALSTRIINSPDCAAWEESFDSGNALSYKPRLGIIDITKFNGDRIQKCISGNKFLMTLSYNKKEVKIEKDPGKLPGDTTREIYPVRVLENGMFYDGMLEMKIK